MAERRYYWLKLEENFFRQKEIKKLRKLAGGDTFTIIYLKMLLRSLENNGILQYEGIESTFAEEIALDIEEDEENVNVVLNFLYSRGLLVEKNEDEILLIACDEMTGSETGSARRMRNKRKRDMIESKSVPELEGEKRNNVTEESNNVQNCDSSVTERYTEKDKERDTNIKKEYIYIVEYLNEKAGTKYKPTTKKTQTCIHARLAEGYSVEDFKTVIDKKCDEWIGTDLEPYLRPETLFGTKFESYLNQKITKKKPVNTGVPAGSDQTDLDDLF